MSMYKLGWSKYGHGGVSIELVRPSHSLINKHIVRVRMELV